ncbi:MAG: hypothetical protein H6709_15310 [Kofleriaceae bacterium]|nr:hypothetical protein [Myxococcales bacterium]MCB9573446.1 hypothetical protein [Kofleriaceae bacterium]
MPRLSWGTVATTLAVTLATGASLAVVFPRVAVAGPDSEVASSFDDDDRFDLHVWLDYEYRMRHSTVMREMVGAAGTDPTDPIPVGKDLVYSSSQHLLVPRLELGIFHDLALTFALPIVVLDTRSLELDQRDTPCDFGGPGASCVDRDSSSTIRDGLLPRSGYDANDPATGFPDETDPRIFRGVDRHGLDQVHLGVVWAPMNQRRDDTKPTWKLGAELRVAVGKPAKFDAATPDRETGVGAGVHEVKLYTSMARRIGWAEPYFDAWWLAPIGQTDASPFQDPGFGSKSVQHQQQAGTHFGFEAIAVDKGPDAQRVSIDLSASLTAHFQGRNYSELWEVFALAGDTETGGPLVLDESPTTPGEQAMSHPGISNIENYLEIGGKIALRADLGPLVHVAAIAGLTRETRHIISFTDAGIDLPSCDAGQSPGPTCEAASNDVVNPGTDEVNPLHVPLIDLVGHRYVVDDALNVMIGVEARVLF